MPNDRRQLRKQLRGTVIAEDRRTERFFRELLDHLGFDKHKFTFKTAPSGQGDAGNWVRAQYPSEVELLREKRDQRRCLIAVRDGDNAGLASKKTDLNSVAPRQGDERIATPVPTWSIETWLLVLLGDDTVDETASRKQDFERRYLGRDEGQAIQDAAQVWHSRADRVRSVPSLADGKTEMSRIDSH